MGKYQSNKPCPKCGNLMISDKYNPERNTIERTCCRCSYKWDEKPLDDISDKKEDGQ